MRGFTPKRNNVHKQPTASPSSQERSKRHNLQPLASKPVEHGLEFAHTEELGSNALKMLSIGAITAVSVCLLVFFTSDTPHNIVAARQAPPPVTQTVSGQSSDVAVASESELSLELIPGLSGVELTVDKDELVTHLVEMDDEAFTELVGRITKATTNTEIPADKAVEGESTAVASDTAPETAENTAAKSLEEAYAEAEALFPGKIDASKRIQLINELNAVDYAYYVAEQGDTLIGLSQAFGLHLGQLVEINGIHDADILSAGEIILLPSAEDVSNPIMEKPE